MSLCKVIYKIDYLTYGGQLAGLLAAISRPVADNRLTSGGNGVCGCCIGYALLVHSLCTGRAYGGGRGRDRPRAKTVIN